MPETKNPVVNKKAFKKPAWPWNVYFLFYVFIITVDATLFFSGKTNINFYYRFLLAYHPYFLLIYFGNLLSVIFNALNLVPFYQYLNPSARIFSISFCRFLLFARIIFDFPGRSYEYKIFKSLHFENPKTALSVLAIVVILHLPSYLAVFRHSFIKKAAPPEPLSQT